MQRLLNELGERYTAQLQGRSLKEAPISVQYVDYAAWQRAWLKEAQRPLSFSGGASS